MLNCCIHSIDVDLLTAAILVDTGVARSHQDLDLLGRSDLYLQPLDRSQTMSTSTAQCKKRQELRARIAIVEREQPRM